MREQRALQKVERLVGCLHSWRGLQRIGSPGCEGSGHSYEAALASALDAIRW
jgi:hypothetical protein